MNPADFSAERFSDPAALLAVAAPVLMRAEAENCFFLGHLPTLDNPARELLWLLRRGDEPLGVALMTPGRQMVITAAPEGAAAALVDQLLDSGVTIPGVQGPPHTAEAIVSRWCAATGATGRPVVRMACHQLDRVTPPRPAPGIMRAATSDDIPLVGRWIQAFFSDIHEPSSRNGAAIAQERIGQGALQLWEVKGTPVSMAAFAGRTPNGIRINLVYTPPEHRGRGYASNNVANLSGKMLDEGRRFCFLYTDLANPISNRIYHAIGYRPVCESLRVEFEARET